MINEYDFYNGIYCLKYNSNEFIELSADNDLIELKQKNLKEQYATFFNQINSFLDFEQNWNTPLAGEQCFEIKNFPFDSSTLIEKLKKPLHEKPLNEINEANVNNLHDKNIRGFSGLFYNEDTIVMPIQYFNRRTMITGNKLAMLFLTGAFSKLNTDVVILPKSIIGAIIINKNTPTVCELRFKKITDISKLFDIEKYFREADDNEIKATLDNDRISFGTNSITNLGSRIKKRITLLNKTEILKKLTKDKFIEIVNGLNDDGHDISLKDMKIDVSQEKLLLPTDNETLNEFFDIISGLYNTCKVTKDLRKSNGNIIIKKAS